MTCSFTPTSWLQHVVQGTRTTTVKVRLCSNPKMHLRKCSFKTSKMIFSRQIQYALIHTFKHNDNYSRQIQYVIIHKLSNIMTFKHNNNYSRQIQYVLIHKLSNIMTTIYIQQTNPICTYTQTFKHLCTDCSIHHPLQLTGEQHKSFFVF